MSSLEEQPPWLRDSGYPAIFTRDSWDYTWVTLRGERFGHVARSNVHRLRGGRRERAIVVRRTWRNRRPVSFEGHIVRSVLAADGWATYDEVVRAVESWAPDGAEAFVLRAVNDKGALLSVLIRLDER